jgi:hypothetical protein
LLFCLLLLLAPLFARCFTILFFMKGKLEKSKGMTVSPNCEVTRLNRPDLQFKFLQVEVTQCICIRI